MCVSRTICPRKMEIYKLPSPVFTLQTSRSVMFYIAVFKRFSLTFLFCPSDRGERRLTFLVGFFYSQCAMIFLLLSTAKILELGDRVEI